MGNAERLQKIIAAAGIASRRKAEALIAQGRVTVNGEVVTEPGTRADPTWDHIRVDGRRLGAAREKIYILLNKPRRVVSTVSDPEGRVKVTDLVRGTERIYPVGRLDYNTEGLLLLTNDGEFARIVGRPGHELPKVYHVKVRSAPEPRALDRLRAGYRLREGTKLQAVRIVPLKEGNNTWLEVTLHEGRNQQIRKMFDEIGHPVMKLRRTRIGFLTAAGLPVGCYRHLTQREVSRILRKGKDPSTDES